jgi:hypothetical protein
MTGLFLDLQLILCFIDLNKMKMLFNDFSVGFFIDLNKMMTNFIDFK